MNTFAKTEKLLLALPQPVAVVGNAVIDRELGSAIDRYPTIIRFNNFKLEGYEKHVGSRTTLRCVSGWHDVDARSTGIEISPFTEAAAESAALELYRNRTSSIVLTAETDIHKLLPTVPNPSTGLALLALLTNLGIEVAAFGFDGFTTGHYWDAGQRINTTHSKDEISVILNNPNVVLYGKSYDYESLYDYCHSQHCDYNVNEGLSIYRKLGVKISDQKIIEFGAGNGALSDFLTKQGNDVTALEVSKVAFDKISVHRKLQGDCITLATIEEKYDRLVSFDVLEHLTENDIKIVLSQSARIAKSILISISTRPSGLTGPKGENLHLTVRSVEWWINLMSRYFDVQFIKGNDVGQVIIEGFSQKQSTNAYRPEKMNLDSITNTSLGLPDGYRARTIPQYYGDSIASDGGITWQPDVYPIAAQLAAELGCDTIVDIGCGHARKLIQLHPKFKIIGVDYGENIEHCRKHYDFGTWLESDFENAKLIPIPDRILDRSMIICSDVIEHLINPKNLIELLKDLLATAPAVVISTPDRIRTYGFDHMGPPANPAHTREWNLDEFERLLSDCGLNVSTATYTRSNDSKTDRATILIVAINPNHRKFSSAATATPESALL